MEGPPPREAKKKEIEIDRETMTGGVFGDEEGKELAVPCLHFWAVLTVVEQLVVDSWRWIVQAKRCDAMRCDAENTARLH